MMWEKSPEPFLISAAKMITNVPLQKRDCAIFFFFEIQISFCSSQCKNKKRGIIPYPVDEKLYFVMPPRATGALSFYEFVWYQGCAFRVPTQILPPMTLLLKAFISSLWQKIDYYPWHLMDSFHKGPFFFISCWTIKYPPKKKKKNFSKTWKEFLSSSRHLQLGSSA